MPVGYPSGRLARACHLSHDLSMDSTGFRPRTLPGRGRRVLLAMAGPAIWLVALLVVAAVERRGDEVVLAVAITGAAFFVAMLALFPAASRRRRRLMRGE